jgi:capsular exopolysaccharide synthesis family protein
MNNKKVLLIGCDLRKPTLHRLFQINNAIGLSSVIIGENTIEECIHETSVNNLFLLPSGPVPPNPAELLETEEMTQVFLSTRKEYDYIILDTPPIALVSDALSLTENVDVTLYVIRQNFSHKEVVNIVNQMDVDQRLPKLGLLINDIKPSKSLGYNYYYGYSQGYNYGYYKYSSYYTNE